MMGKLPGIDYTGTAYVQLKDEQGGPIQGPELQRRGPSGLRAAEDDPIGYLNKIAQQTGQAVRSSDADHLRFDLLCPSFLERMAMTAALGARKYGEYNWTKGFPIGQVINHAENHIKLFLRGDETEPHLIHAAFNLMMVDHFMSQCHCEDNAHRFPEALKAYLGSRRIR